MHGLGTAELYYVNTLKSGFRYLVVAILFSSDVEVVWPDEPHSLTRNH